MSKDHHISRVPPEPGHHDGLFSTRSAYIMNMYNIFECMYMYMEIHVHSTLAKEYKVIPTQTNKGTHHTCTCASHTRKKK